MYISFMVVFPLSLILLFFFGVPFFCWKNPFSGAAATTAAVGRMNFEQEFPTIVVAYVLIGGLFGLIICFEIRIDSLPQVASTGQVLL